MAEATGTVEQRERSWWPDPEAGGITSYGGRTFHVGPECHWYHTGVANAVRKNHTVNPVEELTAGEARRRLKGVCGCWRETSACR